MLWKIANWLARNFGAFTRERYDDFPPDYWALGFVESDDGYSGPLPLGNAWAYARRLGGRVVKANPYLPADLA